MGDTMPRDDNSYLAPTSPPSRTFHAVRSESKVRLHDWLLAVSCFVAFLGASLACLRQLFGGSVPSVVAWYVLAATFFGASMGSLFRIPVRGAIRGLVLTILTCAPLRGAIQLKEATRPKLPPAYRIDKRSIR